MHQTAPLPIPEVPRTETPGATPTRLLGRQPIVDQKGRLFGHELLFRSSSENAFSGDPEQATREVVDQWLMLIPGPEEGKAFVNCTRTAFLDGTCTLLPAEHTVLEVLETVEPDPPLIDCLRTLKEQGYQLALDDFVPLRSWQPLIEFADFVKIDFLASNAQVRAEIYAMSAGSPAQLLAEKIETRDQMQQAQSEGCSLFQGYFFSRPVLLSSRALPRNQLVFLRLLTALNRVPTDLAEVEGLVMSDASLCYRVLRLANSPLHFHPRAVTSVREALLLVGEDAVRRMVTVAIAAALAGDRSQALLSMALVRARFCELLAPHLSQPPSQLYLLGMLSLLDVLLGAPMARILTALPVSGAMKAALAGEDSPLTRALDLVRGLEACNWQRSESIRQSLGLEESAVAAMYLESLRWTSQALHA
jgi:EAL and modified HD-GYP domain-containing signal transduction protein